MTNFMQAKIENLVNMQNVTDIHMCNDCNSPTCMCECHRGDVEKEMQAHKNYENAHNLWMLEMNSYYASPWYKRIFMKKPIEPKMVDFMTF